MPTILGITGAALILLAFILNQTNRWKNDSLIYDLVNFVGSVLLVAYGILIGGYPFVVLNSVWALFSLRDVVSDLKR